MYILNTFFLLIGIGLTLLGIASFFLQRLTRIINAPGGPKMKSFICTLIGVIFIIFSLIVEMPIEGT